MPRRSPLAPPEPTPVDELLAVMGQIAHEVAAVAEKHGLTHQQLLLLRGLEPPRPMGEVADSMCCDPSNVTTMIDRLEGRGLVERTPGSGDRRVKVLSLTAEGRALRRKVDQELEQRLLPKRAGPRTVESIRMIRRVLGG